MSLTGKSLFLITQLLRRSEAYSLFKRDKDLPQVDIETAKAQQWASLTKLLKHCEEQVPYYQEMFRSLGATANDIRTPQDFSRLPILTKQILQTRGSELLSNSVTPEMLIKHSSGGSTGVPVSFFHDRSVLDASDAAVYRYLHRAGWSPGDWVAFFLGFTKRVYSIPKWNFVLRQHLRRMYQFDAHRASEAEMSAWFRTYKRIKPKVAHGFPSTMARFAEYVKANRLSLPAVSGVCTTAESLLPQQRAVIEEVFGGKVFDCYGSSEVRNIATECEHGSMHVNTDYVYLEQASLDGRDNALIVTSLKSYAMPFIRYQNMDEGQLLEGECSCGSGFPLMKLQIGRLNDYFRFPGGEIVHGLTLTHQFYGAEGVASFQFHQTALDEINLYVVPGPGSVSSRQAAITRAVDKLQSLSSKPITVNVRVVENIPATLAGKHRFTRSDLQ